MICKMLLSLHSGQDPSRILYDCVFRRIRSAGQAATTCSRMTIFVIYWLRRNLQPAELRQRRKFATLLVMLDQALESRELTEKGGYFSFLGLSCSVNDYGNQYQAFFSSASTVIDRFSCCVDCEVDRTISRRQRLLQFALCLVVKRIVLLERLGSSLTDRKYFSRKLMIA